MRILFFFLVVSSLALAWLALQQPEPDKPSRVAVNMPRVAHLRLVSEGEQASRALPARRSNVGRDPGERAEAQVRTSARTSGRGGHNPINQESDNPRGLSFDELSIPDGEAGRVSSSAHSLDASIPSSQDTCIVVEGFESVAKARLWLKEFSVQNEQEGLVQQQAVPRQPLHWVLIPPLGTQKEGLELLKRLQRQGVDSYLVTQGEKANAVSLGLFESLRAANTVLRQRRNQGLDVVLTEYPRTREIGLVLLENADLSAVEESAPESVSIRIETDACKVLQ